MNELHEIALSMLTDEYQAYSDIKPALELRTGYKAPYLILSNLVEWGYVEQRVETLYPSNSHFPRGSRSFFKLKQRGNHENSN